MGHYFLGIKLPLLWNVRSNAPSTIFCDHFSIFHDKISFIGLPPVFLTRTRHLDFFTLKGEIKIEENFGFLWKLVSHTKNEKMFPSGQSWERLNFCCAQIFFFWSKIFLTKLYFFAQNAPTKIVFTFYIRG